jgi:nucleoside-diphosphate-sugar epimerase
MGTFKQLKDFYSGEKVVVTGGAGFVGSHLVEHLETLGAEVVVLDNLSKGQNHPVKGQLYISDVRNINTAKFFFKDAFAVFNLAASVAGVLHNMNHNLDMYNENILLQTIPVAAASMVGVPHFLQTSTVCCYAPENNAPSEEVWGLIGIPHQANGGYAEAKRDGERAVEWSDLEHGVIVRPSNIFGPRDYFDEKAHVIPALIRRAIEEDGPELQLYGPPDATREFIYVDDVAWGMLYALAFGEHGEAYNIGCNDALRSEVLENVINMHDLAEIILRQTDNWHKTIVVDESIGGGDNIRWADATKLRSLGWQAKVDLEWGLYETIEWYFEQRGFDEAEV